MLMSVSLAHYVGIICDYKVVMAVITMQRTMLLLRIFPDDK